MNFRLFVVAVIAPEEAVAKTGAQATMPCYKSLAFQAESISENIF